MFFSVMVSKMDDSVRTCYKITSKIAQKLLFGKAKIKFHLNCEVPILVNFFPVGENLPPLAHIGNHVPVYSGLVFAPCL